MQEAVGAGRSNAWRAVKPRAFCMVAPMYASACQRVDAPLSPPLVVATAFFCSLSPAQWMAGVVASIILQRQQSVAVTVRHPTTVRLSIYRAATRQRVGLHQLCKLVATWCVRVCGTVDCGLLCALALHASLPPGCRQWHVAVTRPAGSCGGRIRRALFLSLPHPISLLFRF